MANGKGWIDCIDCANCKFIQDPWEKFCEKYKVLLPGEELEGLHTVCAKFSPKPSVDSILNSEVVQNTSGSDYYIHRRSSAHFKNKEPIQIKNNILYAFSYNEQILRPYIELKK